MRASWTLVNTAFEGTNWDGKQSEADQELLKSRNAFNSEFLGKIDSLPAATLLTKYSKGEITLPILFQKLSRLWHKFDAFRVQIFVYGKSRHANSLPEELDRTLSSVNRRFVDALVRVQQEFFPILRKELLETRLARIEETAKLLSQHQAVEGIDTRHELRQLANDLVCLTQYPVGPAFDEKYGAQLKQIVASKQKE